MFNYVIFIARSWTTTFSAGVTVTRPSDVLRCVQRWGQNTFQAVFLYRTHRTASLVKKLSVCHMSGFCQRVLALRGSRKRGLALKALILEPFISIIQSVWTFSIYRWCRHLLSRVCGHVLSRVYGHLLSKVCGHLLSRVYRHLVSRVCRHLVSRECEHLASRVWNHLLLPITRLHKIGDYGILVVYFHT